MRIIPLNIKSLSDFELLEKYRKNGEVEYLGVLYDRYLHLVYGLCLKYLKNREDSQDAVMDIFEKLSHVLLTEKVQFFKSWLYTVSKNHCLVKLRRSKEIVTMDENFMEIDFSENHRDESIQLEDNLKSLEECIERLKDDQKTCVRLFYLEKKSYAKVSETTKLSLKEVKSYIQNGKRNLKNCMEQKHVNE